MNDLRGHALGSAVLRSDHRRLADGSTARVGQGLPSGVAHVPATTAEVCFVDFNGTGEPHPILRQGRPEPLREEPRGFLRDTQVAVELHARHALEASHDLEDGDDPVLIADLRAFHDRAGLDAELLAACLLTAAERHRLVLAPRLHVDGAAVVAAYAVRPPLLDEPPLRRRVVGEHPHDLFEGNAFAERFAWGLLSHAPSLQKSGGVSRVNATFVYNPLRIR